MAPMTQAEKLELCGSILTFLGGALLVIDTFSPVRELLLKGGKEKWVWLRTRLGLPSAGATIEPPANDAEALRHATRSQRVTRAGFGLITLGFLLDLVAKLHLC
ncbi:MAG TPA: hypothetical protein VN950_05610 [Terriglobales bacterium]|nr:hypothetical protein [Terriglobales bacterium]